MNLIKLALVVLFIFSATGVAAKQDKILVCHVGNETGLGGETYLDDPDCIPSELNDYFCPDAGKIDLIVIAEKAASKHLANPSHYWDGISDYDPFAMGASGEGTEDSDGNGVDDGCEIPPDEACPCWDEYELQIVTAENHADDLSCEQASGYPIFAKIENDLGNSFQTVNINGLALICTNSNPQDYFSIEVTEEEYAICIDQIAERCDDIGHPIY